MLMEIFPKCYTQLFPQSLSICFLQVKTFLSLLATFYDELIMKFVFLFQKYNKSVNISHKIYPIVYKCCREPVTDIALL